MTTPYDIEVVKGVNKPDAPATSSEWDLLCANREGYLRGRADALQEAKETATGLVVDLRETRKFVVGSHAVFGSSQHWDRMALLKSIDQHLVQWDKAIGGIDARN